MAKLSTEDRKNLSSSDFVFPDKAPGSGSYPINDREHAIDALARSSGKSEEAAVRRAVKRKFPDIKLKKAAELRKAEIEWAENPVDIRVPLWKDEAKQLVYGVVLVPGLPDSQGDVISKEEIEKAAHGFLERSRQHDVHHSEVTLASGRPIAETVESYIAPQDMTLAGQQVVKGSWVMGVHVNDPDTWGKVQKGELDGFSIGGTGDRTPIAA